MDNKNQKKSFYKQFCLGAKEMYLGQDLCDFSLHPSNSYKLGCYIKNHEHPYLHSHSFFYLESKLEKNQILLISCEFQVNYSLPGQITYRLFIIIIKTTISWVEHFKLKMGRDASLGIKANVDSLIVSFYLLISIYRSQSS